MRAALLMLLTLVPVAVFAQTPSRGEIAAQQAAAYNGLTPIVVVHGSPVSPVAAGALRALLGPDPLGTVPIAPVAVYPGYATPGYPAYAQPRYVAPADTPYPPPPAYPTDTSGDFKN